MDTSWIINWPTTALIFLVVFYLSYEFIRRRNLPPGPFSLPVLGSIGFYRKMSELPPHEALVKAAATYGDIFSVWVGPSLLVVLNGYDAIHQAFVTQGSDFTDRPNWIGIVKHALKEGKGVSWSNGKEWKTMRKFCLKTLREFGVRSAEIEQKILTEVEDVQTAIRETKGKPSNISYLFQMAVSNVISSIVFGQRFEYDDKNLHDLLETLDLVVNGSGFVSPINFLPRFLHPIFPKEYKIELARERATRRTRSLVSDIYDKHVSTFDPNNIRDFMDIYIQSANEELTHSTKEFFHKGNMWRVIYDLFLAGSETTSKALEWAFLFMIEKPDIQKKCQEEISNKVGTRPVTLPDSSDLPYIEAVLNEILRMSSVVPMGVPRTNETKDVTIQGFIIPKKSIIMPNMYSAHFDPKYWPEPFEFRPERFLDSDGKLVKKDSFVPLSIGPRNCLGDSLSRFEMFLMFSNLLQKFTFLKENDMVRHDFVPKRDQYMTLTPKHYKLKAVLRT